MSFCTSLVAEKKVCSTVNARIYLYTYPIITSRPTLYNTKIRTSYSRKCNEPNIFSVNIVFIETNDIIMNKRSLFIEVIKSDFTCFTCLSAEKNERKQGLRTEKYKYNNMSKLYVYRVLLKCTCLF